MSEIDPDIGAAWQASGREQPPAALDARILAAARREVGARPGRIRAAPRWWPLAAAATVAAVAVGIVQMTPPEQVTPAALPPVTSAARQEANPAFPNPGDTAEKHDAPPVAAAESQRTALREEAKPIAKDQRNLAVDEAVAAKAGAGTSAGSFAAPPGGSTQDKKTMPQSPAQPQKGAAERDQASKEKAELAAAMTGSRQNGNAPAPGVSSPQRNKIHPFPAAATPAPAEAGASSAPPPMVSAAPPATVPAPAASPAPASALAPAPPSGSASAPASVAAPAPTTAASRKLAAQSSSTLQGGTSESASTTQGEIARNADALGKKVATAEANQAATERRKDAAPLAPDEWIKRIRRLIADGKNEDAARELAAFRREYKDRAEALLPSDLRTFRP
jgi:hypothetical protein